MEGGRFRVTHDDVIAVEDGEWRECDDEEDAHGDTAQRLQPAVLLLLHHAHRPGSLLEGARLGAQRLLLSRERTERQSPNVGIRSRSNGMSG